MNDELIKDLQTYKKIHNLTINDIANQLDIPYITVSSWLNNINKPSAKNIQKLKSLLYPSVRIPNELLSKVKNQTLQPYIAKVFQSIGTVNLPIHEKELAKQILNHCIDLTIDEMQLLANVINKN